jgi:SSS family solute:Na+ symporter
MGFFWKRATANGALAAAIAALPISIFFDKYMPEVPFMNAMGYSFLILVSIIAIVSLLDPKSKDNENGLEIDASMFKMSNGFAIGTCIVLGIITALYTIFW